MIGDSKVQQKIDNYDGWHKIDNYDGWHKTSNKEDTKEAINNVTRMVKENENLKKEHAGVTQRLMKQIDININLEKDNKALLERFWLINGGHAVCENCHTKTVVFMTSAAKGITK